MEEEQIHKKDIHTKKPISTIQDTAWIIALLTGLCYFLSFSFEKGARDYYGIDEIALSELGTSSIVNAIYNMSPIVLLCFGSIIGSYILSILVKPLTKWLMKHNPFLLKYKENFTDEENKNFTKTYGNSMENIVQTVLKGIIFLFLFFYFLPSLILGSEYKSLLNLGLLLFIGTIGSGILTSFLAGIFSFIFFKKSSKKSKDLIKDIQELQKRMENETKDIEELTKKFENEIKEVEREIFESSSRQHSQVAAKELRHYLDETLNRNKHEKKLEILLNDKRETDNDEENLKGVFEGNLLYNLWNMSNLGIKFTIIVFVAFCLSKVVYQYGYTQAEEKEDYFMIEYEKKDLIVLDKNKDLLLVTPLKEANNKFIITKDTYKIIALKSDKLNPVILKNVEFKNGLATSKNDRKEFFINKKELLEKISKNN